MVFLCVLAIEKQKFILLYIAIAFVGFFLLNQLALSVSLAVGNLKVSNISFANSLFFVMAQILAFCHQIGFSLLIKASPSAGQIFLLYLGSLFLLTTLLAF